MPPIETGPTRPIGRIEPGSLNLSALRTAAGMPETETKANTPAKATVVRSDAIDPGEAPVDTDRVTQIRKALEQGTYPILPTKVADAIIAAGLLLKVAK
jgi:negative regulator of flagellin synthesis FlgM